MGPRTLLDSLKIRRLRHFCRERTRFRKVLALTAYVTIPSELSRPKFKVFAMTLFSNVVSVVKCRRHTETILLGFDAMSTGQ